MWTCFVLVIVIVTSLLRWWYHQGYIRGRKRRRGVNGGGIVDRWWLLLWWKRSCGGIFSTYTTTPRIIMTRTKQFLIRLLWIRSLWWLWCSACRHHRSTMRLVVGGFGNVGRCGLNRYWCWCRRQRIHTPQWFNQWFLVRFAVAVLFGTVWWWMLWRRKRWFQIRTTTTTSVICFLISKEWFHLGSPQWERWNEDKPRWCTSTGTWPCCCWSLLRYLLQWSRCTHTGRAPSSFIKYLICDTSTTLIILTILSWMSFDGLIVSLFKVSWHPVLIPLCSAILYWKPYITHNGSIVELNSWGKERWHKGWSELF